MADKPTNESSSNPKPAETVKDIPKAKPGDGIRSMQSTPLFRAVNFELYAKPVREPNRNPNRMQRFQLTHSYSIILIVSQNIVVMAIGGIAFASAIGYMAYMRSKYESLGYYAAQQEDGSEIYARKQSKWD